MNIDIFVEKILVFNGMPEALTDVYSNFGSDLPVVLLSSFGRAIANNVYLYSEIDRKKIFTLIESAINSGDQMLEECVATGLLEALYNKAYEDAEKWKFIESQLGAASKKYIVEWLSFPV